MRIFNKAEISEKSVVRVMCLAAAFVPVIAILVSYPVSALTMNGPRDCDSNAVIRCGALTPSELQTKYDDQASVATIYHNFGITHIDIEEIGTTAVAGKVTVGGRVLVNGEEVANSAITAGRQNISGSQAVTANGVTFYKRPPSVSFASSSLAAFVVMKNGQFDYAIIASCGNPVSATPVKPKSPAPAPAPVSKPTPTPPPPAPPVTQTVIITKNVAVPTPAPAPTPVPVPQPQPQKIPNTGIGDMVGLGSVITLASGGLHYAHKRSKPGLR